MTEATYADALIRSLREIVSEDDRTIIIGGAWAGAIRDRDPIWKDFALEFKDRILYPPIAENALCGVAIGAAMGGLRPLINIGMAGYSYNGWSQIVNEAANISYMTSGRVKVPMVLHMFAGGRPGSATQHTQHPEANLGSVPGLEVICPAGVDDVGGLLKTAVARENPTIFINNLSLLNEEGPIPDEIHPIPFGESKTVVSGGDVTVLAFSSMVSESARAAQDLKQQGVSVEVIDARTIVPFDWKTLTSSVTKTGRLVVAEPGQLRFGLGSEIAAVITAKLFGRLRAPVARVGIQNCPTPAAPSLKQAIQPNAATITQAIRDVMVHTEDRAGIR